MFTKNVQYIRRTYFIYSLVFLPRTNVIKRRDFMLAVIRVFTTTNKNVMEKHAEMIKNMYGIYVKTYCIPDQPYGIHDEVTEILAIPKIVQAAKQAEHDGADCIFISCAADPALQETRQAVAVPVIAAGSCAAALCMAMGQRVGVLNLTGNTPASPAGMLANRLVAEITPSGVDNTTDLLTVKGEQAASRALKELALKCDVIMLACTGFATIGFAAKMQPEIKIPIVDAVEAAGAVAYEILRKKISKM